MSKEHNLAVAKRGLALPETFTLRMESYCSTPHATFTLPKANACNTSFCFAGYLAALDDYPSEYRTDKAPYFKHYGYSLDLLGIQESYANRAWYFLFSHEWPDTFKDLKERCQYVIDNDGEVPEEFKPRYNSWEGKQ